MLGLIGKKVVDGILSEFRFIDLESGHIIHVPANELALFVKSKAISNLKYNWMGSVDFIYQDLLSIPNYYENNEVSSYFFKVILDRVDINTYKIGNITGSVETITLPSGDISLDLYAPYSHSMVVNTSNRIVKFDYQIDGTYTVDRISESDIKTRREKRNRDKGFKSECYCKGSLCYYSQNDNTVLGSFKKPGYYSVVKNSGDSYKIESYSVNSLMTRYDSARNLSNVVSFRDSKLLILIGIDGLTFLSEYLNKNIRNSDYNDFYYGLLAVQPESAELFDKHIKLGVNDSLIYCNVYYVEIPDGVKTILPDSLCVHFENVDDYHSVLSMDNLEVTIPKCVENFSNLAFREVPRGVLIDENFYNRGCISFKVENSDIYLNVIKAFARIKKRMRNMYVTEPIKLDYTSVLKTCEFFKWGTGEFSAPNISITNYHGVMSRCLEPYEFHAENNKARDRVTKYIVLESFDDFMTLYSDTNKKLDKEYKALKTELKSLEKLVKGYNFNELKVLNKKAMALTHKYIVFNNMITKTYIKTADVNECRKFIRSVDSKCKYLNELVTYRLPSVFRK